MKTKTKSDKKKKTGSKARSTGKPRAVAKTQPKTQPKSQSRSKSQSKSKPKRTAASSKPALVHSGPIHLKRILVPVDFSEASRQGVKKAVDWAEHFGASLTLMHVVPSVTSGGLTHIYYISQLKEQQKAAEGYLKEFCKLELNPELQVDTRVVIGSPYQEIAKAARQLDTDMIVMSTHGFTGLKHAFLGSTAERVVRHAPCPVLAVREVSPQSAASRAGMPKSVLVPTDLSLNSQKAVQYAVPIANHFNAPLTLLHVVEPPMHPQFGYARLPMNLKKMQDEAQKNLEQFRDTVVPDQETEPELKVRTGQGFHEICEAAVQQNAGLIVISTHGYTGFKHVFIGSTAERIVRHAPCPVLVVRLEEHEFVEGAPVAKKEK